MGTGQVERLAAREAGTGSGLGVATFSAGAARKRHAARERWALAIASASSRRFIDDLPRMFSSREVLELGLRRLGELRGIRRRAAPLRRCLLAGLRARPAAGAGLLEAGAQGTDQV